MAKPMTINNERQITDYLQEQLTQCQKSLKVAKDECDRLREVLEQYRGAMIELSPDWPPFEDIPPQCDMYLRMLYRHKGIVVTKEAMYTVMYSERHEHNTPEVKIIEVQICKLRKYMPPNSIETVWGRGYILTDIGYNWVKDRIKAYQEKIRPQREHQLYRT
jgi:hypothetical protein